MDSLMGYEKVSLGFAEFTAKLIEESFEAILSAQEYQIERYAKLTRAINGEENVPGLISSDDVESEIELRFDSPLDEGAVISNKVSQLLTLYSPDLAIKGGEVLTAEQAQDIRDVVSEALYEEKIGVLSSLLTQTIPPRIMVSEGEITTKLELSNFMPEEVIPPAGKADNQKAKPAIRGKAAAKLPLPDVAIANPNDRNFGFFDRIPVQRVTDPDGGKVIMVGKPTAASNIATQPSVFIPDLRLIAKPATQSSKSSMLAQLTIRFKTV